MQKRIRCRKNKSLLILLTIILLFISPLFSQTLTLEETLARLGNGVEFRWDPLFSSGTFINGNYEASFYSGRAGESGALLLDRRQVMTLPLPYLESGRILFPEVFVRSLGESFLASYTEDHNNSYRIAAIIIDPGHGGIDPGTVWDYVINGRNQRIMEKDIVLRASLMLHASLSAAFPDRQVILTRDSDVNPTREERVNIANSLRLAENEIAIFISVHANSSFNRNATGFEIFYLDPGQNRDLVDRSIHSGYEEVIDLINDMLNQEIATESIILANNILRRFNEAVGSVSPNRGIKPANWFVVRNALMPAVLVELGFVSNRDEALRLIDEAYLMKLSDALYKGISDFIVFFERSGGNAPIQ